MTDRNIEGLCKRLDRIIGVLNDYADKRDVREAAAELRRLSATGAGPRDLQRENDILRAMIAKGPMDCVYCGLPAADMNKCASGFPGCGRADDMMADPRPDMPPPVAPAQSSEATATEQAGGDATVAAGRPEPIGYCESPRHDEGRIGWGDNMGGYEE